MFERRAYRRKSGGNAASVLLALSAAGLLFLILRPGADKQQLGPTAAAPIAAPAAGGTPPDAAQSPVEPKELAGLRQQVEQASQDLNTLRSAAAEMRTELGELRKQRAAMAQAPDAGQPAPVSASGPAESVPHNPPGAAPEPEPKGATAEPSAPAARPSAAEHPAVAQPARTAPPSGAKQAAAPKPVRHAHNATGYLLSARDQLQSGNASAAEDALERAETWALNSSGAHRDGVDPADDPLVVSIRRARADLRAGRSAAALRMLDVMLPTAPRTTAANRRAER